MIGCVFEVLSLVLAVIQVWEDEVVDGFVLLIILSVWLLETVDILNICGLVCWLGYGCRFVCCGLIELVLVIFYLDLMV